MKVKLGELTRIRTGKLDANAASEAGEYPFFTCSREPLRISSYSYDCECVLVAGNGDLNVKYYNGKFDAYQRTYIIQDNGDGRLFMPYLFYFMDGYVEELRKQSIGGVIKYIKLCNLTDALIELPDIEAQKGIVSKLAKSKKIVEFHKLELKALDDLVKARFVEMFGDFDLALQNTEWTPISQIGTVVGGSTPKTGVAEYWDGDYRWISPAELKADSGIIYDSVKKITKAGVDSCSLQELPVGTVILSSRAPIGKVAIAGNTFYCNQGFKNIICNDKVLPRYLYTLLLFNSDYLNSLGRGATFKEISKSIVERIRIPLPSIDKQKQFETIVAQIDKSKLAVQKALDEAQLLFDCLMQEYFG